MNRSNQSHNRFRKVTKPQRASSRLTICLWVLILFVVTILSLSIYAFHLNSSYIEEGSHVLKYIRDSNFDKVLTEVMDKIHLRKQHESATNSIDPRPSTEVVHVDPPTASVVQTVVPTMKPSLPPVPAMPQNFDFDEMHFIHIPKCGGTTMTAVLRQFQCQRDPEKNKDCCTNPGFCDWHAMRRCSTIKGCINHFPNRKYIYKEKIPSITVFREPTAR